MQSIAIAVDAMGGDHAPQAIVEGCVMALRAFDDISITLCGPEETLQPLLTAQNAPMERVKIIHAPDVISMHESPVMAVRRKAESSMVRAMLELKNGDAQAFVSAGSTGAILAGGMMRVGRIKGIERPAIATVVPGLHSPFLLIDSGANVDCQPLYLDQFGLMGSIYMEKVMNLKAPRVGLVNIGAEETKGNVLAKQAYERMSAQSAYHFVGNVEARDVPLGQADVVVCDGFDGNLLLKYTEGLAGALMGMLKEELMSGPREKLGAMIIKPALKRFKKRLDYEAHGGAPLLGVNGAMIKAHGSSSAEAIKNAIRQARSMAQGDVAGVIRREMEKLMDAKQEEKSAEK